MHGERKIRLSSRAVGTDSKVYSSDSIITNIDIMGTEQLTLGRAYRLNCFYFCTYYRRRNYSTVYRFVLMFYPVLMIAFKTEIKILKTVAY